ncbi:hypothetical protein KKB40_00360 [Patescibacteria group bacterium]|nr:hypothetical protein [Patescibacteria group bacterium]
MKWEELLEIETKYFVFIYLNDISKSGGIPNAYLNSILQHRLPKVFMEKSLFGYKCGLAYIWSVLRKNPNNKISEHILSANSWTELDHCFNLIRNQIICPLEAKKKISFVWENNYKKIKKINSTEFSKLKTTLKKPTLTKEELLNQHLLWYETSPLYPERVFNGVNAFTLLLTGTVTEYWSQHNFKPRVIRFTHPEKYGGNKYSYAILLESSGIATDYSGWILFYSCATDFSGFGGNEHRLAEQKIQEFKDKIILTEIKISEKELLNSLDVIPEDYKTFDGKGRAKEVLMKLKDLENQQTADTGNLLELLTVFCLMHGGFKIQKWSNELKKKTQHLSQMDLLAEKDGINYLIECQNTIPMHSSQCKKMIEEINSKKNCLKKLYSTRIVTANCLPEIKSEFEKSGIEVVRIFDLLEGIPIGTDKKKQIIKRLKNTAGYRQIKYLICPKNQ